jgi:hypothetical protein
MPTSDTKFMSELTLGRSLIGTIGGIAAIVLAILGLAHLYPEILLSIATIAIGVTLLFKGGVIAAEYSRLLSHLSGSTSDTTELGGGMSVELIAGAVGVVLGILALLGIESGILNSIAVIVFGAGLIIGGGVISRLNALKVSISGAEGTTQRVSEEIVSAAMGTQVLVGIAAIVLGILSLIGFAPTTLSLVALLAIGGASLLTGTAITGKMIGLLSR